jgi:uncharacterized membrane protein
VTEAVGPDGQYLSGRVLGLRARHAAALAWAGGWFSGLVMLWLDPQERFVRLHALQAVLGVGTLMAIAVGSWALGMLMAFVTPVLFRGLTWLSTATWFVLAAVWLFGLVQAWRGRALRLPLISGWADRLAARLTSRHSTLPAPQSPL